mmetsp:Transcript_12093/g.32018  ORF Transcript_12093/g.32018 Transcript_12093/m.32018 type:complete len:217 (+) Transcript_12093:157-807(+)
MRALRAGVLAMRTAPLILGLGDRVQRERGHAHLAHDLPTRRRHTVQVRTRPRGVGRRRLARADVAVMRRRGVRELAARRLFLLIRRRRRWLVLELLIRDRNRRRQRPALPLLRRAKHRRLLGGGLRGRGDGERHVDAVHGDTGVGGVGVGAGGDLEGCAGGEVVEGEVEAMPEGGERGVGSAAVLPDCGEARGGHVVGLHGRLLLRGGGLTGVSGV